VVEKRTVNNCTVKVDIDEDEIFTSSIVIFIWCIKQEKCLAYL